MQFRIRQYAKPSGKKVYRAERKRWLFWHSLYYFAAPAPCCPWLIPREYGTPENAERDICQYLHEKYARWFVIFEYRIP